ncbi:RNA-directed DNA polymerase, eukaryota [Tanacetum coccineum]
MHADSVPVNMLSADNKCLMNDNLEIKRLEQENDHLFELFLSQEIVHICVNCLASRKDCHEMQQGFIHEYNANLMLKAELAKKGHMVENKIFDKVVLRCSRLENHNVNLELKLQHQKECLAQKAKKDWVRELCEKHKVNFVSLQETKMEDIELFNIKLCWGNFGFEFVHSPSVGNSGGILCIWDPRLFRKLNSTISDYFVIIQGEWAPNGKKLIIISVYAPQELREKKMLWDYLILVLKSWNGDVIIMGDFNEVRTQDERHGSIFNAHGADAFNLFISSYLTQSRSYLHAAVESLQQWQNFSAV